MRLIFVLLFFTALISQADQPIMNMMPRWDGGYGYQVLYEYIDRENLLEGDKVIGKGWGETIQQLHIQGVYTWDRSIRITAKLPIVLDAERINLVGGQRVVQQDKGIGDLTLALPLKKYFNLMKRTGNWSVTPQIRVPLSSPDEYDVWDRAWGAGLFIGYETEVRHWFFATGTGYWTFENDEPNEWHASIDAGWNFRDNAQLLWESDWHYEDDGKHFASLGPALYWRYNDNTHLRFEYKRSLAEKASDNVYDHVGGNRFQVGVGFVY